VEPLGQVGGALRGRGPVPRGHHALQVRALPPGGRVRGQLGAQEGHKLEIIAGGSLAEVVLELLELVELAPPPPTLGLAQPLRFDGEGPLEPEERGDGNGAVVPTVVVHGMAAPHVTVEG